MDDIEQGVKEAMEELAAAESPFAAPEEPVTEPIEEPAAEGETGDEPQVEIAAPAEPVVEQTIPYERFKEVNDKAKYWEDQARLQQEQLQRLNTAPVEPEPEPDEDYSITSDEWEFMDDASKKVYLQNQILQEELKEVKEAIKSFAPVIQQTKAQAQAQEELKTAIADITDIAGPMTDAETQLFNAKLEDIARDAIQKQQQVTVTQVARMAYKAMKSTPVVPPKPVVNPGVQKVKEAVAPPGLGTRIPSGAKPVIEGTMSFEDSIRSTLNEIPRPTR